jgi:HAE1 family hydrophobic/amphiphilic exporter-1
MMQRRSLSDISIENPVFAWMLMAALIMFGAIAFTRLGVSNLPDVDFPVVSVTVEWEGAAPQVIESDVIDILEEAVMGVEGVTEVTSSSKFGRANINVNFELERNIDLAMQDIQAKVSQAMRRLPQGIEAPIISKSNPEDNPILWMALSGDGSMSMPEMMSFTRDYLKNQFSTLSGVSEVFLGGYVEPNLRVWVNGDKLSHYQLTVNDLIAAIQNEHSEPPAGRLETPSKEYNLRVLGEATSPEDFGRILINTRGGQPNYTPLRLNQVSRVEMGLDDVRRISRFKGRPSIGLGVRKQRGANAVAVSTAVKKKLETVKKELPKGLSLDINFDATNFIREAVDELIFTLFLSALLTSLVCYLFLGTWSSTFNVLLAIPTSIIGTFLGIYYFGFTLNTFTLLGLSLAIGIVVDDAIMVLENIMRHVEMGKNRVQGAADGAREVTFAALAATVAIAAIFIPVAFMKGIIGKFFFQFGVTMTVAVFISLLEALTLTPMRSAAFLRTAHHGWVFHTMNRFMAWCDGHYRRALRLALSRPVMVCSVATAMFLGSLLLIIPMRKEMIPAQDQSIFMMRLRTAVGSTLQQSDQAAKELEKYFETRTDLERYFVAVGDMGGGDANVVTSFVTLKPPAKREKKQSVIMDETRKAMIERLPGVVVNIMDLSARGFGAGKGYPVEMEVQGDDWGVLSDKANAIMEALEKTAMLTDIDTNYRKGQPEIQIMPNREAASRRGVSVAAIGTTINALLGSVVVGQYTKGGHRFDIRVRLEDVGKDYRRDVERLFLRNNRGELVPMAELVTIKEEPTLQSIHRRNKERAISIHANLAKGVSQKAALEKAESVAKDLLPPGYRLVMTGGSGTFKETMNSLFFALIVGLIVSYMILASQFNSFIHPTTVLLALPFSITGAFGALLVTGQSLNMFSFIGIILLMGIVKKNSILLVDFANQRRKEMLTQSKEWKSSKEKALVVAALMEACPQRLRPILMTSLATIAAAIPPALAIGPGAETRIPMSVAVIGGVLVSTILTLVVVPAAYLLFSRLEKN